MSAEFDRAATLVRADAVRAWGALSNAQRSSLRRCHVAVQVLLSGGQRLELPLMRVRSDTHARTKDALRSMGILVPADLHLSEVGAIVRRAGMDSETTSKRSGR